MPRRFFYFALLAAVILAPALFAAPEAHARPVLAEITGTAILPQQIHIFEGDQVAFKRTGGGGAYYIYLSFGTGTPCQPDTALNAKYHCPYPFSMGATNSFLFDEPPGTVLHVFVDGAYCDQAVATITIHGKAASFERYIPAATEVSASQLAAGKLSGLCIDGTLVLDADTTIEVEQAPGRPDMLEVLRMGPNARIRHNRQIPEAFGAPGLDGYDLTFQVVGGAYLGGQITLNGTHAANGTPAATPLCPLEPWFVGQIPPDYWHYEWNPSPGCASPGCGSFNPCTDSGASRPANCSSCWCCYSQDFWQSASGDHGGSGATGGAGGAFTFIHQGELLLGSFTVTTNGGSGGGGQPGSSACPGHDKIQCDGNGNPQVLRLPDQPVFDGNGGRPGQGGDGGSIVFVSKGRLRYSGQTETPLNLTANGGSGGMPGSGASSHAGGAGGAGGTITVDAGCAALRGAYKAEGGTGGLGGFALSGNGYGGGPGGPGGEVSVRCQTILSTARMSAGGANGKNGQNCNTSIGGTTAGAGGDGGTGGLVKLFSGDNRMDDQWADVGGGDGGAGGTCGAARFPAGEAGEAGAYTTAPGPAADIDVSIRAGQNAAAPGETITYTAMFMGTTDVTGVTVLTVYIPEGTRFVSATGDPIVHEDQVEWQFTGLNACTARLLTASVRVNDDTQPGTVIENRASALVFGGGQWHSDPVGVTVREKTPDWIIEGYTHGPFHGNSLLVLDPVNTATGNFVWHEPLFFYPHDALPLAFTVTYNSRAGGSDGPLGFGFTHALNLRLVNDTAQGDVQIFWGDGHVEIFKLQEGAYRAHNCSTDTVVSAVSDPTGWLAQPASGPAYRFGPNGELTAIVDNNANAVVIHREPDPHNAGADRIGAVTDAAGRQLSFVYNETGKLASISGPGISWGFSYTQGNLTAIRDATANAYTFTYHDGHRMASWTNRRGQTMVENTYDDHNRVVSQQGPGGQRTTFAYETAGTLTTVTITLPEGQSVQHVYDDHFNLVAVTDGAGGRATFEYEGKGRRVRSIDKAGGTVTRRFDGAGNPVSVTDAAGNTTTTQYNSLNLPVLVTDPLGRKTRFFYDGAGNLLSRTDPTGQTARYRYNDNGLLTAYTDVSGRLWQAAFNDAGLPVTLTDPDGRARTLTYDAAGRLTGLALAPGIETTVAYDQNGTIASVTDPMGHRTSFTYDADGNRVTETFEPTGAVTAYAFDAYNRVTRITDALGGRHDVAYDGNGNLVSATDPDGVATAFSHDGANRLSAVISASGARIRNEYDLNGSRLRKVGGGVVAQWEYDKAGRLIGAFGPSGMMRFARDGAGRLLSTSDALDRTTAYSWDALDRLTRKTLPDGSFTAYRFAGDDPNATAVSDSLGNIWKLAYDAFGRPTVVSDPNSATATRMYDGPGRLVEATDRMGRVFTYGRDANGRLITVDIDGVRALTRVNDASGRTTCATADGLTVIRNFDLLGRPTGVTDPDGRTVSYTYTPAGRPATVTYPGQNKVVTYGWDDFGRLATITDWKGNTTAFTYDALDRLTETAFANGTREIRQYDGQGRFWRIRHQHPSSSAFLQYDRTFDAAGQVATVIAGTGDFGGADLDRESAYAMGSRLAQISEQAGLTEVGHDANGNLTVRTGPAGTVATAWDPFNRLTGIQGPGMVASFAYDPDGRLVGVTENGTTSRFLADGLRTYARMAETGAVAAWYVWHGNRLLYGLDADENLFVFHGDFQGHVTAVTNPAGTTVVNRYTYDPFGRLIAATETVDNPFRYMGTHGVISAAGLCITRTRAYDPLLRRFLSEDPLGIAAGTNVYAVSSGNPLTAVDPLGLEDTPAEQEPVVDAWTVADFIKDVFGVNAALASGKLAIYGKAAVPYAKVATKYISGLDTAINGAKAIVSFARLVGESKGPGTGIADLPDRDMTQGEQELDLILTFDTLNGTLMFLNSATGGFGNPLLGFSISTLNNVAGTIGQSEVKAYYQLDANLLTAEMYGKAKGHEWAALIRGIQEHELAETDAWLDSLRNDPYGDGIIYKLVR